MIYQLGLVHTAIDRPGSSPNCTSDLTRREKGSNATYLPTRMVNNAKYFGFFRKFYLNNPRRCPASVFPNFAFATLRKFYRARVIGQPAAPPPTAGAAAPASLPTGLVGTLVKLAGQLRLLQVRPGAGVHGHTGGWCAACWIVFRLLLCFTFLAQFLLALRLPAHALLEYPWFRSDIALSQHPLRAHRQLPALDVPAGLTMRPPLAQKLIARLLPASAGELPAPGVQSRSLQRRRGYDSSNDPSGATWRQCCACGTPSMNSK
uniref:Uncharacterized protein n=1 Tax=Macrostomum lignano TaxID=282301 RepID=A0A1I8F9J5_9PLAT